MLVVRYKEKVDSRYRKNLQKVTKCALAYRAIGEKPNYCDKARTFSVSNVSKGCNVLNLLLSVYLLVLSPMWCNIIGWGFRFRCAHALSGYSISKFLALIEWQVFCDTFHLGS